MTEHVELYDKNCEFVFWLNIIKLTKFVNFFYKKKLHNQYYNPRKLQSYNFKVWDYNCKFLERKLAVDNNCRFI